MERLNEGVIGEGGGGARRRRWCGCCARELKKKNGLSSTYTFRGDGGLVDPPQLLDGALIVSQVLLAGNQKDRETATEVLDLGEPL